MACKLSDKISVGYEVGHWGLRAVAVNDNCALLMHPTNSSYNCVIFKNSYQANKFADLYKEKILKDDQALQEIWSEWSFVPRERVYLLAVGGYSITPEHYIMAYSE